MNDFFCIQVILIVEKYIKYIRANAYKLYTCTVCTVYGIETCMYVLW